MSKSYNKTKSLKTTIHQTKKNALIVSKHSKKMLIIYKPILQKLEKESALSQFNIKENSIMRNFLAYIYLQFSEFNKIINTLNVSNSRYLNSEREKIKAQIRDHLNASIYIDPNIITYISNNINNCKIITYENTIHNKKFIFNFVIYDKININNLDNIVKNMLVFLQILIKISKNINNETNKCSKDGLSITFFLTPFLKKMNITEYKNNDKNNDKNYDKNKEILGVNNVNSGFAYVCLTSGLIFIYRKQEFFKVFVHEALHAYGIDTALHADFSKNNKYNKFIKLFAFANKDHINIGINEALTEFWTALLFLCVNSYQYSKNLTNFIYNFERLYKLELVHALYQINKILRANDLTYSSFINASTSNSITNSSYRETTHIFSYFIVKTLMLINHEHMLNSHLFDLNSISNMNKIDFNSFINIKFKHNEIAVNKLFSNLYEYTLDPLFIKTMNTIELEYIKHYNNYAKNKTYKLNKKQKHQTRKFLKHKSNINDSINMENYMLSNLRMMIYDYTI